MAASRSLSYSGQGAEERQRCYQCIHLTTVHVHGVLRDLCRDERQTLTGTFFCVTTTAQSFPLTATDVSPPWFMALNAYSVREIKNVMKSRQQSCRDKLSGGGLINFLCCHLTNEGTEHRLFASAV